MHVCIYVRMYVHMHVYVYACMNPCIYVSMYLCIYVGRFAIMSKRRRRKPVAEPRTTGFESGRN